ncbi:MAG: metal-dependent transcriptional regulator [Chloroflexi bacterium]|nr:MAG: metal-dependent transcriptional regulator [Chloroflexota bacterium]
MRAMLRSEIAADLTATVEDYLQSIYSLETEGERIISARLARWMRVTPPTAWATVRRMARDGLVSVDAKKTIHLTKRGRELAEKVARRHRLSERFLNDVLGLGWAEAHDEAHHFEHGLTPAIEGRIFSLLGNPTTCPHGSPIPGTGAVLSPDLIPMDRLEQGDRATVEFISEELEEDLDLLRYLDRHNVRPGQAITVDEKVPSTGLIAINTGREPVSLGVNVAARIRVRPDLNAAPTTTRRSSGSPSRRAAPRS